MKYLNTYKIFEVNETQWEETHDEIKDIFQDLIDDNKFSVEIRPRCYAQKGLLQPISENHGIVIIKQLKNEQKMIPFRFSEIEDYVYRLKDYLGDKITRIWSLQKFDGFIELEDLFDEKIKSDYLLEFQIIFEKR